MFIFALILSFGIHTGVNNRAENVNILGKLTGFEKSKNEVVAHYESGEVRVELFKAGIFHLSVGRGGDEMKSFAVVERPGDLSAFRTEIGRNLMKVDLPEGVIEFSPGTLNLKFLSTAGTDLLDLDKSEFSDTGLTAVFDIGKARDFFGLGEKTLPYNRYGSRWTMWNSDFPAYGIQFDPLYESIPFLLKADTGGAYGIFFDNASRSTFDIGATDSSKLIYKARAGRFELYIITGKNAAEVVRKFSELTGKMHMPPVWSLGYQQSRWSYYPESSVLDLAHGFRERGIPCDVIYLDIDYMDGYKCFTWSPENFPTPKNMIDTLHSLGFKVVTIIDPGIKDEKGYGVYDSGARKNVFVRLPDGKNFVGRVWPGNCVFPDFFRKKVREWWGGQYRFLLNYGVDGFWNDMNEPSVFNSPDKTFPPDVIEEADGRSVEHYEVHNAYGMQMARGTREGLEKLEPDKRPFVLTRSNYAGGQRYAAMWTGDNFASFAHLRLALAMFLNIGVSGQPFVGSDIGGFIGNPSAELFTRWLELGSFTPFFRTHSVRGSKPREPWAFGPEYTKINRSIIERRYELLPEIYTAFRRAHESGLPIVRPLYLDFPSDPEAYKLHDEFIFGSKFLVAPVLDSGTVKRKAYFPAGSWVSLMDGTELHGGWHEVDAPLGAIPVFVKEGTIIFTQSIIQSTAEQPDTLFLRIYGEKTAEGNAYFDDGETYAYRNGDSLDLRVTAVRHGGVTELEFASKGSFKPNYKKLAVQMHTTAFPHDAKAITQDGRTFNGVVKRLGGDFIQATFPFDATVRSIRIE